MEKTKVVDIKVKQEAKEILEWLRKKYADRVKENAIYFRNKEKQKKDALQYEYLSIQAVNYLLRLLENDN